MSNLFSGLHDTLKGVSFTDVGSNIVNGIWKGISDGWDWLKKCELIHNAMMFYNEHGEQVKKLTKSSRLTDKNLITEPIRADNAALKG